MTEEAKKSCPSCGSADYSRLLVLEIEGQIRTICNICHPAEFRVPLEVREEHETVSTGMFRAKLDWTQANPVVEVEQTIDEPPSFWKKLRALFKKT